MTTIPVPSSDDGRPPNCGRPGGSAVARPAVPGTVGATFATVNLRTVVGLVFGCCWLLGPGSVAAIVLARQGRREIVASEGQQTGLRLATITEMLGWLGVAFTAFCVISIVLGAMTLGPFFGGMSEGAGRGAYFAP